MNDLISRSALLDGMSKRYNEKSGIVPDNLAEGFVQMEKLIKEQTTDFDLEITIGKLEEVAIEELGITKEQFAMDRGEYSSYCSLTLSDVEEILKSAVNAANGKNGG